MQTLIQGQQVKFVYPSEFTTLPDYTAHANEVVTLSRPLENGKEYDDEGDAMWEIVAADGWIGHAFESELEPLTAERSASCMNKLACGMVKGCAHAVTHIDEKGFVYCAEHGAARKHVRRCRQLRPWEHKLLNAGKPLPSYKPGKKPKAARSAS